MSLDTSASTTPTTGRVRVAWVVVLASIGAFVTSLDVVVVSKDLTRYSSAEHIVPTMQAALDSWEQVAPYLDALYRDVEHWSVPCGRFHEHDPRPVHGEHAPAVLAGYRAAHVDDQRARKRRRLRR